MKQSLPLSTVHINDSFWNRYTALIPNKVIPYQWEILNDRIPDAPPSCCLKNFRIAAGEETGERKGTVFQDSDAAKWLEAVAYSLAGKPDPQLEKTADDVIDLIGRAQEADGYLNTYFSLKYPGEKWKNLTEGHELYCAGHFIEAAAAYYETTGKKAFLAIVCRLADLICKTFGPAKDQIHGYPGHPEIELALVKLYRISGNRSYLDTAKYFVEERGQEPNYFIEEMKRPGFRRIFPEFSAYDPAYSQSHLPVRQQDTAEGHAVRAVYLYCAMADLAEIYSDKELLERCVILWNNIVQKRMFVTGSIGSSGFWERFTVDYDLPNDSNYSETCASIGLALFGLRMARITGDGSYIDTVERALYNTIRAGISLEGDRYFYVNPLEVWPENCIKHSSRSHVKPVRQKWFDCACCPTNEARTLTSLGQYIYFKNDNGLFINLFIQNETSFDLNGNSVNLSLTTDYPRTGKIRIAIKAREISFSLHIRIPGFADDFSAALNGKHINVEKQKGYITIDHIWDDDEVMVQFSLKPRLIYANPLVRQNCGKIALARGPEIYCLEETDNGGNLSALSLDPQSPLEEDWRPDLFGGTMVIKTRGKKLAQSKNPESFFEKNPPKPETAELSAVPYGLWGNRGAGEMLVWIRGM
ncbi:hypothetical protein AGMMS50230_18120 [Spirochaetia bacterium]|nr:hypothetical protein AGMMS50230_18120 [Spirochaetia bacterium]